MENSAKIYRTRKSSFMWGGLFVLAILFFGLTLPLIIEGVSVPNNQLTGLTIFWVFGLLLTFGPLGFSLEVGEDYTRMHFLWLKYGKITASDVKEVKYTTLRAWGYPIGKGLKIYKKARTMSNPVGGYDSTLGESAYGPEAIKDVMRALQAKEIA